MTKKMVQWDTDTEYVSYVYVDNGYLVMSFQGDQHRSHYYMVWYPHGKLFEPRDTDLYDPWYNLVCRAESIEMTSIESLADLKPNNCVTAISMLSSLLYDIDVVMTG